MIKLLMTTAMTVCVAGAALAQSENDQEMRSLTSSVLAGLTGTAPAVVETAGVETDALSVLVEQAMSEGQSDAYLEALLSEAADKGLIEVTDGMRTTTGDVDTKTLLASLVAKSLDEPAPIVSASLEEEATGEKQVRYHQVVSGESLAAISLTYYGEAQAYDRIFQANRDSLSSPNLIRVGQTLLIPS